MSHVVLTPQQISETESGKLSTNTIYSFNSNKVVTGIIIDKNKALPTSIITFSVAKRKHVLYMKQQ